MHTFKTMSGNEFMQGFLLDLKDQVDGLHEGHRAIAALGLFVEIAGSSNAAPTSQLASLMRLVGEAMEARTTELEAFINAAKVIETGTRLRVEAEAGKAVQ